MEFAKMIIQYFAENDELDTTNQEEDTELEQEFDDNEVSAEETEDDKSEEETAEEPEKVETFTQDQVDDMIQKRIKREKNKFDREYKDLQSKLDKYEELAYLTQQGLEADDFEDTLNKSREFYSKKGIVYNPTKKNTEDDEIIASYKANEIIDTSDSTEDIQEVIDELLQKGTKISAREKLIAEKLIGELNSRNRLNQLKSIGVEEKVYNSKEFKDFEKKFDKNTPISDVYELYKAKYLSQQKEIKNPGSMKNEAEKSKKTFITEKEYDKMTDEEIEKNMDLIMESMKKW